MMKHPPPKRDREMIELGVICAFSALVLIAVMVTIWIVGIKT
jgi:Flp pilus assembly pilin Flp